MLEKNKTVIILRNKEEFVAVAVDSIKGQLESVIKPFSELVGVVKGFKGTTVLDNEHVVYVVDLHSLPLKLNQPQVKI